MKTLVFSDVHLTAGDGRPEVTAVFLSFLRGIDPSEVNRVVMLGDLFDFWFEYKHVIFSGYFDVLRALADLRDGGVELHFVCGNHDFWAGRFLRDELRFEIHRAPFTLDFGEKKVLFAHGDGINPKDYGYRLYKRIARFPLVIWLFRQAHPDWAMALGRAISGGSRQFFSPADVSKGPEIAPVRAFAARALEEGRADAVMCGHTHYPQLERFSTPRGTGLYINSGDWLYHRTYVEWDGARFRLLAFRENEPPETVAESEAG